MHVSVEVRLAQGDFEGEEHNGIVHFSDFHHFWVYSHMADSGSTIIRVQHVFRYPIQERHNAARVARVLRDFDV